MPFTRPLDLPFGKRAKERGIRTVPRLTALSHKPEPESKICAYCGEVFYRKPAQGPDQWKAVLCCNRSHSALLGTKTKPKKRGQEFVIGKGKRLNEFSDSKPALKKEPKVKRIDPSRYEEAIDRLIAPIFAESRG